MKKPLCTELKIGLTLETSTQRVELAERLVARAWFRDPNVIAFQASIVAVSIAAVSYDVSSPSYAGLILRPIQSHDQDNLRTWKNENRYSFFHRELITPSQQAEWFRGYQEREHDYVFMVVWQSKDIGCMGIRLLSEGWDVYNVILGGREMQGRGIMRQALRLMLSFAYAKHPQEITLKVLKTNPAVEWYGKNGFSIVTDNGDFFLMRHGRRTLEDLVISTS